MTEVTLGGGVGLLLGMGLGASGLCGSRRLRGMLALRDRDMLRMILWTMGIGATMTALLCYLAVIDTDTLTLRPLHGGTVVGGGLFGVAMGLIGRTPGTALGGMGRGAFWESLCTVAGCLAGTLLLPLLAPAIAAVQGWFQWPPQTLFRMTLTQPWLVDGGFGGQACFGLLLMALALAVRPGKVSSGAEADEAAVSTEASTEEPSTEEPSAEEPFAEEPSIEESTADEPSTDEPSADTPPAEDATFVAALPGEEPVVVDTSAEPVVVEALPEDAPVEEEPPAEEESPAEPDPPEEVLPQMAPFQQISLPVPAQTPPPPKRKKKKSGGGRR